MKTMQTSRSVSNLSVAGQQRRRLLGIFGGTLAATTLLASCSDDIDDMVMPNLEVNLGSGDIGILNYAYALEQLEAAFYTRVAQSFYSGATSSEIALLTDIRDHEVAHREFFKNALGSAAIPGLEVDFSSINFSDRNSVLTTARTFEDLGVSAYNGAGKLIVDPAYLLLAGKIVSVEARHAAYIRELIQPGSYAGSDVVDSNGLDVSRNPPAVLAAAGTFIKTKINASNLPTS